MNKNDLIARVADTTGLAKQDAIRATEAVFDIITDAMKQGVEVKIVGFGNFHAAKRAASKGRNPQTGQEIDIPASVQPKFKASKNLKDALNG